jgi:hypothetical protein
LSKLVFRSAGVDSTGRKQVRYQLRSRTGPVGTAEICKDASPGIAKLQSIPRKNAQSPSTILDLPGRYQPGFAMLGLRRTLSHRFNATPPTNSPIWTALNHYSVSPLASYFLRSRSSWKPFSHQLAEVGADLYRRGPIPPRLRTHQCGWLTCENPSPDSCGKPFLPTRSLHENHLRGWRSDRSHFYSGDLLHIFS